MNADTQFPDFTPREREVLELLGAGCPNRDIAATLQVSVRTVESHVASICAKLHARTRGQAASRAIAAGFIAACANSPLVEKCEALHGERCCLP
jgi:DNA-binding NarL/FixJ family response regulator